MRRKCVSGSLQGLQGVKVDNSSELVVWLQHVHIPEVEIRVSVHCKMLILIVLVFNCCRLTDLDRLTQIHSIGGYQRCRIQKGRFCSFFLLGPLSTSRTLLMRVGLSLSPFPIFSLFFKLMRGDGVNPI